MSWLSSLGGGVKRAVTGVGHAVGSVASNPWVQGLTAAGLAATGVGAPLAAGIMAAERGGGALLKPGGNIGEGIRGGVEGAALGAGAAKAGGVVRGLMGAGTGAAGGIPSGGGLPGTDVSVDPANASSPGGAPDGGFDLGGTLGALGGNVVGGIKRALPSAVGGGGGMSGMQGIMAALAAIQAANAAKASGRAGDFQGKAIDLANANWAAGAPLRTKGSAGLLDTSHPDLSSVYGNSANPFARKRAVSV